MLIAPLLVAVPMMVLGLAGYVQTAAHASDAADSGARAATRCGCGDRSGAIARRAALADYGGTVLPTVELERVAVGGSTLVQVSVTASVRLWGWLTPVEVTGVAVSGLEPA